MGCFSFLCQRCGKGICSDSYRGERCYLFLLKEGEVIQEMHGEYNSYGAVFEPGFESSVEWKNPFPEEPIEPKPDFRSSEAEHQKWAAWGRVCRLMHDGDEQNGIAAWHEKCYLGQEPRVRSASDPNQGWGEEGEYFGGAFDPEDDPEEETC